MMRLRGAALALAMVLAGPACADGGRPAAARDSGRPRVVASFYPLFEVARRVGGERVEARNLTPPGVEPHDLEPSPRLVDTVEGADLVLYVGRGFQPAIEAVVRRSGVEALDLLDGVRLAPGPEEGGAGGGGAGGRADRDQAVDPHVWLDPALLAEAVGRVEAALARVDAAGASVYAGNATRYREELGALDAELAAGLRQCRRRILVTAHASFGYLARRHGLEQRAVVGVSPGAEPDPRRLAQLADVVRSTGTTTVFAEALLSPKVAEALARETGATVAVLNPLEGLTAAEADAGATYASVMRANLAALIRALDCAGPGGRPPG